MRFIHTADWHIGLPRTGWPPETAAALTQARFGAVRRLAELARDLAPDFILLAGDLFDGPRVDPAQMERLGGLLAEFTVPLHIIPGNHDPASAVNLWRHPALRRAGLILCLDEEPRELPGGGLLFPCPLKSPTGDRNPLAHLLTEKYLRMGTDRVRVGLAHGGRADGNHFGDKSHPVDFRDAEKAGLDYLALGHWHGQLAELRPGRGTAAYCGALESCYWDERESGQALLVEISAPGAAPKLESLATGRLSWERRPLELSSAAGLESFLDELRARPEDPAALRRFMLTGFLPVEAAPLLDELRGLARARFLWGEVEEDGLKFLAGEDWLAGLPAGPLAETARILAEAAREDPLAGQALAEFQALWRAG